MLEHDWIKNGIHDYDGYFARCIYQGAIKMAKMLFINFDISSHDVLYMQSCYGDKNYDYFVNTYEIIESCQSLIFEERRGIPIIEDRTFMGNFPSPRIMNYYKSKTTS